MADLAQQQNRCIMEGYNIYLLNKECVIENKKRLYLDKICEFYEFFKALLDKNRFIRIEEYEKKIDYLNNIYSFINQLKSSNVLLNYLNYNEKLNELFLVFLIDYENIKNDIIIHNEKFQNVNFDNIKNKKIAKNILLLIKSLNKSFEKSVIINILKGNELENIINMELNKSKGFARLKNENYQDIKHQLDELIKMHYLKLDELNCLKITKKGIVELNNM